MRSEAVRTFARQRLTPTQYRRVAKVYGFHDEPMTLRQIAAEEGVHWTSVHESHQTALATLQTDARLLLLWLTIWI